MALKGKLVDPVQDQEEETKVDTLDMDNFDFKSVPFEAAKIVRPFDGYPLPKKVKFGSAFVYPTFIVALNPTVNVQQDPNNKKVLTKEKKFIQVKTYHSRMIRDREVGDNIEVVFDREIKKNGVTYYCAVVPSHIVRSQLIFNYNNKTNRIEVDPKYMLMDLAQTNRLKQVFQHVINPNIKMEREASFISGKSEEDPGEVAPLTENEV